MKVKKNYFIMVGPEVVFIISSYFSVFLNLLLHERITNAFGKNKQNPTKSVSKAIYIWKSFSPRK